MKSQKKAKTGKMARKTSKKARPPRKEKSASTIPLIHQREVEQRFIAEHPEAFDPFVGEYVVLEGTSIVAHGSEPAIIADEARAAGIKVPLIIKVVPNLGPDVGYL